jgi:hypothetical protein
MSKREPQARQQEMSKWRMREIRLEELEGEIRAQGKNQAEGAQGKKWQG